MKNSVTLLLGLGFLFASTASASVKLNWEQMGGADYFNGSTNAPSVPAGQQYPLFFSPIEVGQFQSLTTEGTWIADVGTQNSNVYLFASATINGVSQIIAKTDIIRVAYGQEVPIEFIEFFPFSGAITLLHLGESISAGHYVQMNYGQGTNFVFDDPVTAVPEPMSYILMMTGLGLLGFVVRHRK